MIDARKRIVSKIKIDSETGCWNYTGNLTSNGYARTSFRREYIYLHRLSYMAFIGPIEKTILICHKCDNRKCLNPEHLFIGTQTDNMQDCKAKSRLSVGSSHPIKRGESCHFHKLTSSAVAQIKALIKKGISNRLIGQLFGVSPTTISKIRTGKNWKGE